jgi:hypothetical protein
MWRGNEHTAATDPAAPADPHAAARAHDRADGAGPDHRSTSSACAGIGRIPAATRANDGPDCTGPHRAAAAATTARHRRVSAATTARHGRVTTTCADCATTRTDDRSRTHRADPDAVPEGCGAAATGPDRTRSHCAHSDPRRARRSRDATDAHARRPRASPA